MLALGRFRNPLRTSSVILALAALIVAAPEVAAQTTYSWAVGGTGDFGTPANWTPTGVPGIGDIAVLNRDGAQPIVAASRTNLRLLADNNAVMGLTLQGGTSYTLTGNAGQPAFAIGSTAPPPSFLLRAAGTGVAALTTAGAAISTAANGVVTLDSLPGSEGLQWNNTGDLAINPPANSTTSLAVTAGSRISTNGLFLGPRPVSMTVTGSGARVDTGTLTMRAGSVLTVNSGGSLTTGGVSDLSTVLVPLAAPRVAIGSGGTWTANGEIRLGSISAAGELFVPGGTVTANANIVGGNTGRINVTAGGRITVTGSGFIDLGFNVSSSAQLSIAGAGSEVTSPLVAGGIDLFVTDGATLTATNRIAVSEREAVIESGGRVITGSGDFNPSILRMGGLLRATASDPLYLGNRQTGFGQPTVIQTGPATFQTDAFATLLVVATSIQTSATNTFASAGTTNVSSVISGSGSVVKQDAGTLTFTGASTYTGGTVVNGGRLLANNAGLTSATGSGAVTVNSGGTLGGTGRIAGMVSVNGGAILAPGASPGVLTVAGPITFAAGSGFAVELNGPTPGSAANNHDQLSLVGGGSASLGDATLSTTLGYAPANADALAVILGGSVTGRFAGLPDNARFAVGNFGGTTYHGNISYQPTAVVIFNMAPVPEPGTLLLTGMAAAGAAWWARRRR